MAVRDPRRRAAESEGFRGASRGMEPAL